MARNGSIPQRKERGSLRLSLFEKVIVVNCVMLLGESLAGLWVTSHSLEAHHYLIDTSFLVLATLLSLSITVLLLRASFRPLFNLMTTIRVISAGKTETRAVIASDPEIGELATAYNSMLDRLEGARKEQALLILQAHEEERRRIARELHDETSQNLTALLVHTEVLQQGIEGMPDESTLGELRSQLVLGLKQLVQLTQQTLESTRMLAQQLRPAVLDDLGLAAALRWLVEDSRQRLQLAVSLQLDPALSETYLHSLPHIYQITLFRIIQECLTNIARHAHAQHVQLRLGQDECYLILCVTDDGQGFDMTQPMHGLGVRGMRERTALLDGTLTVQAQLGQGTTVQAFLPLSTQMEEDHYAS